ncbi:TetR family transcriptional regulator [Acaricomes phytoseiuli]|uniref:TetR/AcrR family transcriptional regulator n=1 Tax=Acaricomes phytoseiuli TaxID=291968 RepID=UPI002222980F|nr:TetR family transcriptional regulator [Acaricomes phytoseiuli]MCW1249325.1 TetR family transcriptional regulator [Acaricomes phytoseiuli]
MPKKTAQERRTEILDAALRVIAEAGVRGLRVEQLAVEAGVSTALIYYHFKDRSGVLLAALEHVNRQAEEYTEPALAQEDPENRLRQLLLLELQDTHAHRLNSIAWGELRASAVFTPELREPLRASTQKWTEDIRVLLEEVGHTDSAAAAEHLTALLEGLSERWHSGSITYPTAQRTLSRAINLELSATDSAS